MTKDEIHRGEIPNIQILDESEIIPKEKNTNNLVSFKGDDMESPLVESSSHSEN